MLTEEEYVVFDLETTGLYPHNGDSIIEIGAVKMKNGEIIDSFDELIDPGVLISDEITNITCITNDMLKGKRNELDVLKDFLNWVGDLPMVAHNANFDISFVENAIEKYGLDELKNMVIDTLGISRYLDSSERHHNLATLTIRYNIPWEEDKHHRADYDAKGTALILIQMLKRLELNDIKTFKDLSNYKFMVIKNRVQSKVR